ncbi:hypothetical protein SAMN06272735_2981 [Streptomyces sp. TLI_55]|uniref:hypothetical protein n=1 Tax=Streptomyces sp. TLI_55 TaxID=1938861 RepID=UPI000BC9458F|nr:hypothetical protein [Streptomyces sp. TLI_55]SNX58485.1 hypothetical protein SAMN06272735_2981 [Streptomyces sp. TLI_55]
MTTRKSLLVALAGAAALAIGATAFLPGGQSEADEFKASAKSAEFCRTAAPLDLQQTEQLTPHKREHIIEDLNDGLPEGAAEDFGRLLAWYEHPEPEHEEAARESSYAVGEFIELVCADINIGGIRASR